MGYVYAFRHGNEDLFKIGQTTATPAKRQSTLQTNCIHPLSLFDAIETDEYKALEKYIKTTWADRIGEEGGNEILRLTTEEATALFERCRAWLAEDLPLLRQVEQLEIVEPQTAMLAADETTERLRDQWKKLHAEEVRAEQEYSQAKAARERVENELKLTIGTTTGIEGVATWEPDIKSRRISADLVETNAPDLFDQCLVPTLSADKLKALLKSLGRESEYESFQEVKRTRRFKIAG